MKQTIFTTVLLAFLGISTFTFAQVGIGTTTPNPSAILDLNSTDKALLLPRVANVAAITNPVDGMMVYDTNSKCSKVFENGLWSSCLNKSGNLSYSITPSNPDNEGFHGTIEINQAIASTFSFTVRVTNNASYPIDVNFSADDFLFEGVNAGYIKTLTSAATVQILPSSSTLVTCQIQGVVLPTGVDLEGEFSKFGKIATQTIVKSLFFSVSSATKYNFCSQNLINRTNFTNFSYIGALNSINEGQMNFFFDFQTDPNVYEISAKMNNTDLNVKRSGSPLFTVVEPAVEYTGSQSGTYSWPTGVPTARLTLWGGGGSGGSRNTPGTAGGGGGGAYCTVFNLPRGSEDNYTIIVGNGPGTTPSSGNNNGTAGPNAVFINGTVTFTAGGGGGGSTVLLRGAGGICTTVGGTIIDSETGVGGGNNTAGGGCGNNNQFDLKGQTTAATPIIGGDGASGNPRGGGGGGAVSTLGGNNTGGSGTASRVRVEFGCPAP